jgi:hypothetical protein
MPATDLQTAVADLTTALDAAAADAQVRDGKDRTQIETWAIDALGVMHWPDDSMACKGVAASNKVTTEGYILFLVKAGVPVSRELEYHSDGARTVFCGFSR